jgi:predicted ArsR family transcriptional regulator
VNQKGEDSMTKSPKPKTKKQQLIQLLTRKSGADVATISKKLGWQTHTTRAALTGLRKAGYEVLGEKPDEGKPKRYRISAMPAKIGETALAEATDAR